MLPGVVKALLEIYILQSSWPNVWHQSFIILEVHVVLWSLFLLLHSLQFFACLRLECVGRHGPVAHTPSQWWGWERGRKRHPCRDHFEICEDFRAIWTRCQSAPDSKGWQRYPTVQYGSLFNELLTVPRFNWCDIWAIYLWHFNEGWFSALPFTFLCYFLRVICILLL